MMRGMWAGGLGLVLVLSGCSKSKSTPTVENFKTGLGKYLAGRKLDCLFGAGRRFPYESTDPAEQKQLDALVKEQLLTRRGIGIARYEMETTAYAASQGPRFCYGERAVTSVDGWTPLTKVDNFYQTTVSYHFQMTNAPVWAKSDEMKKAYPEMAQKMDGAATGQTTMAQTQVGWQVPE